MSFLFLFVNASFPLLKVRKQQFFCPPMPSALPLAPPNFKNYGAAMFPPALILASPALW